MTDSRLARQTAERLIGSRAQLLKYNGLVGFDGFVDTILEVVEQRQSATKHMPYRSLRDFAKKIGEAAGKSANFEVVPTLEKIGGNGPIMAFALSTLGAPVEYIGMVGNTKIHPVFDEFARRAKIHGIADPGLTSALEFTDGKLMLGQHATVNEVSWENIKKRFGDKNFAKLWHQAHFIAMVNWTMLPNMSALWKKILSEFKPAKNDKRKLLFFDLCDPAKRIDADLAAALKIIGEFQQYHNVILGLNESEAIHVAKVLRLKKFPATQKGYAALAGAVREKLGLHTVVVHPVQYACGADADGEIAVEGPYTAKPKISTGAGDHFNTGFLIGRLLGLSLAHSLQLAVANSGFYVRHAQSPNREQLVRFLQTL
ncbi:MAG: carbohydrate kinase family protein [Verrucomicrobiales bacterium]|jgi:sugar/nucleoside kinase (ribokinase family)|nr:carbohydrate kinase family protein [Verrucomicrobiales bacterium]MDR1304089.1 carbohydrate kinase family protein [Verrucomicrobiales bacterium]